MKYRPRHVAEYALLRLVGGFVQILPARAALAVGWTVAAIGYAVSGRRIREARRRIAGVTGEPAGSPRVRRIAWISWRNLMFNGVEALRMMKITAEDIRGITRIEGEERVQALRRDGRGFVLAIAHTGNWELAGLAASLFGLPMAFIARPQKNPLTNGYLDRIRRRIGRMIIPGSRDLAAIPALLRAGSVLGILVDVRAKTGGVRLPFLNGTAVIPSGMARFAFDGAAPVVPVLLARDGWSRHRWTVLEPVTPDPARPAEEEIPRVTREVLAHLDRAIQAEPAQFYWYNKRWVLVEDPPPSARTPASP